MADPEKKLSQLAEVFHQFDVLQLQTSNTAADSAGAYFTARDITKKLHAPTSTVVVKRQIVSELVDVLPTLAGANADSTFNLFVDSIVDCVADPDMQLDGPIERSNVSLAALKTGNLAIVALHEIATKIGSAHPAQAEAIREKLNGCNPR